MLKISCSKCNKMFTGANSNRKTLWLYHIHNHVTELHNLACPGLTDEGMLE